MKKTSAKVKRANVQHPRNTKRVLALAGRVDALKLLRRKLEAAEARMAPLKKACDAAEQKLLEEMLESKTEAVRGKVGHAVIVRQLVPTLEDQKKFEAYVIRKKAFDLYQRRLNTQAWRDRVDAGEIVPGVKGFPRVSLRVS